MAELKHYQVPLRDKMIQAMLAHNVCVLSTPTGTGKTYIAADACRLKAWRPLVLCPKSVITTWRNVLKLFGVEPLGVYNWEKLKAGKTPFFKDNNWSVPEDGIIIADEVHKGASGMDSQTGEALARTRIWNIPVVLVSATLASAPLQMRHTGYLLGLHAWKKPLFVKWMQEHGCYFDPDKTRWVYRGGKRFMQRIRDQLSDRMVTCSIDDVPEFPECSLMSKLYDVEEKYRKQIDEALKRASQRLREKGSPRDERERAEYAKVTLFCDLVEEHLEQGMSVCVFVNFRETLTAIEDMLRSRRITNISKVHGGQDSADSTANRDAAISAFCRDDNHVCLLTAAAGGAGISLHSTDPNSRPRIALINPSWSASEIKQVLGRIHRLGSAHKAVQVFVLSAGTIEETVHDVLNRKIDCINTLNDTDLEL